MNYPKKVIKIIESFPAILQQVKLGLQQYDADFILDVSDYSRPSVIMSMANPDELLLNLKLTPGKAHEVLTSDMENSSDISIGMITNNPDAYYENLCSTFESDYCIKLADDFESISRQIARQQVN
jgi:hypothetical protein